MEGGEWKPVDFSRWQSWLGRPHGAAEPIGAGKDPRGVFKIAHEGGHSVLRVSGEVFGVLGSPDDLENYHFRVDFKWGTRRWPPREEAVRNAGLLYHATGPHGLVQGTWMEALQFQIQEKDCGDLYTMGSACADVEGDCRIPGSGQPPVVYRLDGPVLTLGLGLPLGTRALKCADAERPAGEWNTLELLCVGRSAVHIVNGRTMLIATNLRRGAAPLGRGRLQIQSEGAELYFRRAEIRALTELPGSRIP
jgi:hypothetical protein